IIARQKSGRPMFSHSRAGTSALTQSVAWPHAVARKLQRRAVSWRGLYMTAERDTEAAGARPDESGLDEQTVARSLIPHSGTAGDSSAPSDVADLAEFLRSLVELGIIEFEEQKRLFTECSEG